MGKKKRKLKPASESRPLQLSPAWSYGLLLAVLLFAGLTRVRLLNFPLERDEGEYAYAGELILHGIAPYQLCYTMKLPGTAVAYALIEAMFGRAAASVHFGLLLVNSAAIVLIFLLAKRLFASLGGVIAAATFALLSLEPSVLGFAGHATQFVALAAVGAILVLLKADESQRLALFFWSGVLFGLSFLMKQPGIFFVLFGLFWTVWCGWKRRAEWRTLGMQAFLLLTGAVLPFAATCLILLKAGIFQRFWFWTFSYAREYGTATPLSQGLHDLWANGSAIVVAAPMIALCAAAGLIVMYCDPKTRAHVTFACSFFFFSFAAVCPGLYFRPHYFVLLLPAVALLCAGAVAAGSNLLFEFRSTQRWTAMPAAFFLLCFVVSVAQEKEFFFTEDLLAACRRIYPTNPFAEAVQISDYITSHSDAGDRIAVIGSEPEVYFYSDRRSATGYIYMYPLMEAQPFASTMQKEMIAEVEAEKPRFVVFFDTPLSWLRRSASDSTIFHWSDKYIRGNGYRLIGIADMMKDQTEYHWTDATSYRPRSPFRIFVFDRKGN
jgi:hypothetical protein